MRPDPTEVVIIGSGPYGLSIAAHLRALQVPFRIFGPAMDTWCNHMPAGMKLKSDGFASDLYDPERRFTLKRFCAERGIPYDDRRLPVSLETFVAYGLAFQAQLVPELEPRLVVGLQRSAEGFSVRLDSGATVQTRRVICATGITYCAHVPEGLRALGDQLCSHSSAHRSVDSFAGKDVVVVGGGASALDAAALLKAAGARPTVVARNPIHFSLPPSDTAPSLWQRIRRPHLGLGPSMRSAIYTRFPHFVHRLPVALRLRIVRRHLGPGAGYFVRPMIEGIVPVHEGYRLKQAQPMPDGRVRLEFVNEEDRLLELQTEHVIAATGYKPSIESLPFIDQSLVPEIRRVDAAPVLSLNFESSVPGLYFTGLMAAPSFGPLLRFALGAGYTAKRLTRHLARTARRDLARSMPLALKEAD